MEHCGFFLSTGRCWVDALRGAVLWERKKKNPKNKNYLLFGGATVIISRTKEEFCFCVVCDFCLNVSLEALRHRTQQ